MAKPATSSWAEEVEESSRGRPLVPLETCPPAAPSQLTVHAISVPPIPSGSHRVRDIVREVGAMSLEEDSTNNNFLRRWEDAKRTGNQLHVYC